MSGLARSGVGRVARLGLSLACAAALLCVPARVYAHGGLKSSDPGAGAHLAAVPRRLRLLFTEAPELAFTRVALLDPSGAAVALGDLTVAADSRRAVVTAIRGVLAAGTYTIAWQMAGDDGHVTRGRSTFTIAPGATGVGLAPAGARQPAVPDAHHDATSMPQGDGFGAESPLYVVVRWLQFVGLLAVIGAVTFERVVLGRVRRGRREPPPVIEPARDRAARIALAAVGLVAVSAVFRLLAQSYAMHGAAQVLDAALVGTMLLHTVWGWGWLVQAAALAGAAASLRAAARGGRSGWTLAAPFVLVLAVTPSLAGHAASVPGLRPLAILADGLHVLGASGWLGSLLLVVAAGIPAALRLAEGERGPAVADLVNAFSPTALACAGLVAATGVFAAWLHLGTLGALWQSAYGRTLVIKLAVLSVVVATGAYNWLRVRPALGDARSAERVRRSASVELAVGVLVLAVTAVLVATPTAMDVQAMGTALGR